MRAWKIEASSVICDRSSAVAFTVTSMSSRSTASSGCSSAILSTGISLLSCLVICSSGADSASTTMVIRLKRSSSFGLPGSDHRVHLLPIVSPEVDHDRPVVDLVRLLDRRLDVVGRIDTEGHAPHGLGPLHVVGQVGRE